MKQENILTFAGVRYLWVAVILCTLSFVVYLSHGRDQLANGGTWQGYTLGTLGAAIIVWLSILGIRKRSYNSRAGTVMGWTSAHIYLGLSLIFIATLHTGFEFSWNLHLLAYLFMLLVILSGVVGTAFYILLPRQSFLNRDSMSAKNLQKNISAQHEKILALLPMCLPAEQLVISSALENTQPLYKNIKALFNRDNSFYEIIEDGKIVRVANKQQMAIRQWLAIQLTRSRSGEHAALMNSLLEQFSEYSTLMKKLRVERRTQVLLKIWLAVHIPCTLALLLALTAHILTTFMYW